MLAFQVKTETSRNFFNSAGINSIDSEKKLANGTKAREVGVQRESQGGGLQCGSDRRGARKNT